MTEQRMELVLTINEAQNILAALTTAMAATHQSKVTSIGGTYVDGIYMFEHDTYKEVFQNCLRYLSGEKPPDLEDAIIFQRSECAKEDIEDSIESVMDKLNAFLVHVHPPCKF